jgi:hypothetical protein
MDTGTRTGIVYLSDDGSDPATAYRASIRNLAAWAEAQGALYAQGLLASRPAAGKAGRLYRATDDSAGVIYYDDGSTWQSIGTSSAVDAAAGVGSLRTLGAGALQAAAGNHTHAIGAITGAGGPASLNVGTTAGTVAAGDHTHAIVQGAQSVIKASATTRNDGLTTVTSDPDLTLSLAAGTYRISTHLGVVGPDIGLKVQWATTGSITLRLRGVTGPTNSATAYRSLAGNPSGAAGETVLTFGTAVTYFASYTTPSYAQETLIVTASGSSTLTLQWGAASSTVQANGLIAGSTLLAERLS